MAALSIALVGVPLRKAPPNPHGLESRPDETHDSNHEDLDHRRRVHASLISQSRRTLAQIRKSTTSLDEAASRSHRLLIAATAALARVDALAASDPLRPVVNGTAPRDPRSVLNDSQSVPAHISPPPRYSALCLVLHRRTSRANRVDPEPFERGVAARDPPCGPRGQLAVLLPALAS